MARFQVGDVARCYKSKRFYLILEIYEEEQTLARYNLYNFNNGIIEKNMVISESSKKSYYQNCLISELFKGC